MMKKSRIQIARQIIAELKRDAEAAIDRVGPQRYIAPGWV